MTTFHDYWISHDGILRLDAFDGGHPDAGELTARAGIPLRNIVAWESAPEKWRGFGGWAEGDAYVLHLIDGSAITISFKIFTVGDSELGIRGDAGQRFTDFDEYLTTVMSQIHHNKENTP